MDRLGGRNNENNRRGSEGLWTIQGSSGCVALLLRKENKMSLPWVSGVFFLFRNRSKNMAFLRRKSDSLSIRRREEE
jgi:hypothetical protein